MAKSRRCHRGTKCPKCKEVVRFSADLPLKGDPVCGQCRRERDMHRWWGGKSPRHMGQDLGWMYD